MLIPGPHNPKRHRSGVSLRSPPAHRYVSFGSECDGGYMDMSKDEPCLYVPMQEQIDSIKYADIQPSPYESPYQQDLYQQQGVCACVCVCVCVFLCVCVCVCVCILLWVRKVSCVKIIPIELLQHWSFV